MKKIQNLGFVLLIAGALFTTGCSKDECTDKDPRARIVNNGTDKASVQIKTSEGSTENINNVEVGTASNWVSYTAGDLEFNVVVANSTVDTTIFVTMKKCMEYDIRIDNTNQITSTPRTRE